MSDMLLVKFEDNYADEFDMSGFQIMTKDTYQEMRDAIVGFFKKHSIMEMYFGTNEAMYWESASDMLGAFTSVEITAEEVSVIDKLFWRYERGWFPDVMDYIEYADNE